MTRSPAPRPARPQVDLSGADVVAGTAAAVLATAAAATLRLLGTPLGAAVMTLIATTSTAVLTAWLRHGRARWRYGRESVRAWRHGSPAVAPGSSGPAAVPAETPGAAAAQREAPAARPAAPSASPRRRWVLAGVVGGVTTATLLNVAGHPALSVNVDGDAVRALSQAVSEAVDTVVQTVRQRV